jgi:hypothetical protein
MKVKGAVLFLLLLLAGCSSSPQKGDEEGTAGGPSALRRYEDQFTPSEYDSLPAATGASLPDSVLLPSSSASGAPSSTELVPGFRVQLLATPNIDEAAARKAEAEAAFPGDWFYIEYDPPAYKLRAGNFRSRFDADRFARMIAARGFADAWTVPERVLRNPPSPPPRPAPAAPDSLMAPP